MTHYLYTLVFDAEPQPVVFYVGHTKDPAQREADHRRCARDASRTEYKYQFCRQLADIGVDWQFVIVAEIEEDEDTEYEWILKFARYNQTLGISFIDDLPLTNMKAGDFLDEILHRTDIKTAKDIKQYKQNIEAAKERAMVNYNREHPPLDYFNPTPKPLTDRGVVMAAYMNELGAAQREKDDEQKQRRLKKAAAYEAMLKDPQRQERIRKETELLMKGDNNETVSQS
jgi:hypothetical protein